MVVVAVVRLLVVVQCPHFVIEAMVVSELGCLAVTPGACGVVNYARCALLASVVTVFYLATGVRASKPLCGTESDCSGSADTCSAARRTSHLLASRTGSGSDKVQHALVNKEIWRV